MSTSRIQLELDKPLPVLFVYIGWANRYDGSEPLVGSHEFLREYPDDAGEARAFLSDGGSYTCGIGRGKIVPDKLHIVFVARDPADGQRKVVGLYASASASPRRRTSNAWWDATTRNAILITSGRRTRVAGWPGDSGIRRWARSPSGTTDHASLRQCFDRIRKNLTRAARALNVPEATDQTYADLDATEGIVRQRLVAHRSRESKLRVAKIRSVLEARGSLVCEVPGCGFDFAKTYGALGYGFAHVHHLRPLKEATSRGRTTRLADLAVVCANCHAMIHRDGVCRPLRWLFKRRR